MIKNIILDVGRVLVAWQPKDAMRELGFDEDTIEEVAKALFDTGAWDETDRGVMSNEEILALMVSHAPAYEKEIYSFWNHVDRAIGQFSYTREWIKGFRKNGYHVYILSNYGSWTYEKTKDTALNFLEDVDGALFSYEVKQIKPEPEIYQTLFDRFQLVPEECVFLDDLAANIEGARKAGMHGIVFENWEKADEILRTEYQIDYL